MCIRDRFEAQDKKRKEAIDARNEAESFVFQTEDALKQVGDQVDPAAVSYTHLDVYKRQHCDRARPPVCRTASGI